MDGFRKRVCFLLTGKHSFRRFSLCSRCINSAQPSMDDANKNGKKVCDK